MTQNLLKTLYLGKELSEDELQDIPNYRGKSFKSFLVSVIHNFKCSFKMHILKTRICLQNPTDNQIFQLNYISM